MASGSKKVSNLPLTKEEQEEEELRNELINSSCGFFYDGISIDEMKMILTELKKSKETNSQNTEPVPPSPPLIESKSSQNSSQTSESNIDRPIPSFSYRQAVTSSNLSTASTSNEDTFNSREKSPDPTSNKTYGKNLNNENNSHDSESIYEKNSNINNDDYPQLGSKSNLKSNSYDYTSTRVLRPREAKKPNPAILRKVNLERWRLDPLQFSEDDDVPLKPSKHVHTNQEEYLPYSNEKLDDETFDALCRQMSEKLDSIHEQMIATESQTIWGSPIKVSGKRNSPADKNSLAEKTPVSSSHHSDVSIRDNMERSSKRKALNIIAAAKQNYSNDENSDEEFVKNTKKRKCQQEKKAEEVPKKVREGQENKNNNNPVEMIDIHQTDDFSDSVFDNSDLQRLQRVKRTKISNHPDRVENESVYPRRITPPNPTKNSFKGPRYRKKNSTQSQSTSKKSSDSLDDSEISKILNNEPDEMDDSDCIDITDEIKPSPNPKGMQKKLNMAQSHLENIKTATEQKIKAEEEARKQKEVDERLKKDELISKRIQEEEDERSRKLEKERKLKEQESLYKNILGSKKRTTRSNYSTNIPRNYEEMDEDELLADGDDDITLTHSNIVTKNCPICQKPFPPEQIVSHASECNLFPAESNDVRRFQPSTSYSRRDNSYECTICNKYTTYDGQSYEEHVTKCKENAEDQRMNGYFVSNGLF